MDKSMKNDSQKTKKSGFNTYSLAGIGIGGIIGAGFFLGTGIGIKQAGPSIVAAFLLGGLIMSQVLGAMTSISINRPVQGSFRVYAEEMLGPYYGFMLGWVVYISGILGISSEAVAGGIFLRYWFPHMPLAIFSLVILVVIAGINVLGEKLMGYVESSMAFVKIITLIIFIISGGIFLITHGVNVNPNPYTSLKSFFPNGLSGFLQSMLVVIFTFAGVSAVAMAASETENPQKEIPKATKYMTLGIVSLYVISMAVIVSITSWRKVNTKVSPFVQAFDKMGIGYASTLMNTVILIATLSVMVASFFACMELLISLSEARKAPVILKTATGKGFHKYAWFIVSISSLAVVLLSFALGRKLFNYLISASSYFTFLNWSINLLTYLAWLKHRSDKERFSSPLIWGRPGAYSTLVAIGILFLISLRVTDFRMGFYVAAASVLVISLLYRILLRHMKLDNSQ